MFSIYLGTSAICELQNLPPSAQQTIRQLFDNLRAYPLTHHLRISKLKEYQSSTYRVRVGDYRVVFEIESENKKILITKIGHRKDVYR